MLTRLKTLFGKDQGFTLIELLIVVLIVGILAAVAVPLYLGYIKDAKLVEGKSIAGAIWTSAQANSLANCGNAVNVSSGYARAGLNGVTTADGRWTASASGTLTVDCSLGSYSANGDKFTLAGNATDLTPMKVKLNFNTGNSPPAVIQCAVDGTTYVNC